MNHSSADLLIWQAEPLQGPIHLYMPPLPHTSNPPRKRPKVNPRGCAKNSIDAQSPFLYIQLTKSKGQCKFFCQGIEYD